MFSSVVVGLQCCLHGTIFIYLTNPREGLATLCGVCGVFLSVCSCPVEILGFQGSSQMFSSLNRGSMERGGNGEERAPGWLTEEGTVGREVNDRY